MTTIQGLAMAIAVAGVLSACGGGSGADAMSVQAPATTASAASDGTVPAAAGTSDQSFADYQKALSPTDTTNALSVNGFTPPADETSLPIPVI